MSWGISCRISDSSRLQQSSVISSSLTCHSRWLAIGYLLIPKFSSDFIPVDFQLFFCRSKSKQISNTVSCSRAGSVEGNIGSCGLAILDLIAVEQQNRKRQKSKIWLHCSKKPPVYQTDSLQREDWHSFYAAAWVSFKSSVNPETNEHVSTKYSVNLIDFHWELNMNWWHIRGHKCWKESNNKEFSYKRKQ